jgi:cyanophycin synthetase
MNVGMTSTSGIYIGNRCIQKGDTTGPISARLVLNNKEIDAAVLETARGGIVRKGLGYDLADVAVLTNITEDHLGIDGVDTLEQLAYIKSLVIEAVKPEGYAVLNADDAMTPYFISRLQSKLILFSQSMSNPLVRKYCRIKGNMALYIRDNYIWILKDSKRIPLIGLEDIPITNSGMIECNVENSLAAAAALIGLGISYEDIRAGMSTFNVNSNPGRFNIFDMGNFRVMIDYSHNIAGYSAVIKYLQRIKAKRLVGVIGMPGDRLDSNIHDVGVMCAKNFEKIYIKEDIDLRGRKQGEVAGLLNQSILESGFRKEDIQVVFSEVQALEKAMLDAQPGDLIILFYEQLDAALQVISKFKNEQETASKVLEASLNNCAQEVRTMIKNQ